MRHIFGFLERCSAVFLFIYLGTNGEALKLIGEPLFYEKVISFSIAKNLVNILGIFLRIIVLAKVKTYEYK